MKPTGMAPMLLLCSCIASGAHAETGHDAWLRYSPIDNERYASFPAVLLVVGSSPVITSARQELQFGVRGMLGRTLRQADGVPGEPAIILGTASALSDPKFGIHLNAPVAPDGYWIFTQQLGQHRHLVIAGANDRGVLYGVFALLRKIAMEQPVDGVNEREEPYAPVRWVNQWDNLDGTIERGYGGGSIFFDQNNVRADLTAVRDYARLLASLGINGCAINNVNANIRVITPEFLPQLARISAIFSAWGIGLAVSVDFSSPQRLGGLNTFDPLDPKVADWWKARIAEIYQAVPGFAGVVLKADSEGRVGPSTYNRTHADAANVIARALKPHGGLIFYRGFVYDHHMDWRNPKNDRARAAYDNFINLDGKFDDNVLVQIKHGPIDFQVREPVSPLFGGLEKTNEAIELQITQEYLGQARHLVFIVPMWKQALDFDLHAGTSGTTVKALVAGKIFDRPTGGFVGVANVGLDKNWLGSDLSQANLYGFGRLAWNPNLSASQIADEWTRLTFSNDPAVVETVRHMQLASWRAYENYTGPLGLQTLTDIVGNHYGVSVEASERNGWGQWHQADEHGVGMDRTSATGTGYIGQYRPPVAKTFESLAECPDELLLFMHHVPYGYLLHSGKTVIQTIYDSHYEGAQTAASYVDQWKGLRGRLDDARYNAVLKRLEYQAGSAELWRDAVNNWFLRASGIPDQAGRAGHFPGRYEAEAMQLTGYSVVNIKPWEAASGGKGITCAAAQCSAAVRYNGPPGWYTISVRYFDQRDGASHFKLSIQNQAVDEWDADDQLPSQKLDGSSSTRRVIRGIALRPGDEIKIEGLPQSGEAASIDYLEVQPQ